jgi:hypothetical protein
LIVPCFAFDGASFSQCRARTCHFSTWHCMVCSTIFGCACRFRLFGDAVSSELHPNGTFSEVLDEAESRDASNAGVSRHYIGAAGVPTLARRVCCQQPAPGDCRRGRRLPEVIIALCYLATCLIMPDVAVEFASSSKFCPATDFVSVGWRWGSEADLFRTGWLCVRPLSMHRMFAKNRQSSRSLRCK